LEALRPAPQSDPQEPCEEPETKAPT
jgi:hypothetical protein